MARHGIQCQKGLSSDTDWLVHNKILRAMSGRQKAYVLQGKIQIDEAYLG